MNYEVQIDSNGFKGKATLDFPTRSEKLAIIKDLQSLGYGKKEEDENAVDEKKIALADRMGEVVEKRLVSLEVTHEESGTVITDKAMLDIYSEGQVLHGILAHYILGGVSLGKAKS